MDYGEFKYVCVICMLIAILSVVSGSWVFASLIYVGCVGCGLIAGWYKERKDG